MIVRTSRNPITHSADAEKLQSRIAVLTSVHPRLDAPAARKV
jgi:hypothetical protein